MKNLVTKVRLLVAFATFFVIQFPSSSRGASKVDASTSTPKGIEYSDWSKIRAAYEGGRYAAMRQENGNLFVQNPGQKWHTIFDGKGFTISPDHRKWKWGLELTGYGDQQHLPAANSEKYIAENSSNGGKISLVRDDNLTEWFINDRLGLEQGWTLKERPDREDFDSRLRLHFEIRGDLSPKILAEGTTVAFIDKNGISALSYGGLKAWDANGKSLAVRFEKANNRKLILSLEDKLANYPITIDPVAQQAYLKASNAEAGDRFGEFVAISGDTVVVGASDERSNSTGINGDQTNNSKTNAGAVYVFVRINESWTQQAYIKASNPDIDDLFGSAVAICGDTLVVGAGVEDSSAVGINGDQSSNDSENSGAVYVFHRNGTTWTQQAYLKASNTGINDRFGAVVSISGDTILVGALREDSSSIGVNGDQGDESSSESGAAYVYVRNGATWTQQAYLKASNTEPGDLFGYSVSISGDTAIIGALEEDSNASGMNGDQSNNDAESSGAAYIFVRSGATWTQQAYLKASNTDESGYARFGYSLAIEGDTVAIGADQENSSATGIDGDQSNSNAPVSGAVYVFSRNTNIWTQQAYIKASNTDIGDRFGSSVALSGNTLVVGAVEEQSNSVGIDGDQIDNSASYSGAAYFFRRNGVAWSQQAYLKASNTDNNDSFGGSVAVSCDTAIIGAFGEESNATGIDGDQNNNSSTNCGAAYLFHIPLLDFENAMESLGLTDEDAEFDSDPDNDGLANGLEWVLGGNPTISSNSVAPILSFDENNAFLTFNRLDLSECSVDLKVQWSADLSNWTDLLVGHNSSEGIEISENGTLPNTIMVAVLRNVSTSGKLFLRLVAVRRD